MAVELNDNIFNKSPKLLEAKSGPYTSLAEALSSPKLIPAYRSIGLSVFVNDGELVEYWFRDGIADADLIEKSQELPTPFTFTNGLRLKDNIVKLGLDITTLGTTDSGVLTEATYLGRGNFTDNFSLVYIDTPQIQLRNTRPDDGGITNEVTLSNKLLLRSSEHVDITSKEFVSSTVDFVGNGINRTDIQQAVDWLQVNKWTSSGLQQLAFQNIGSGHKMYVNDGINNKGLEYPANYSANFTDRSLVDKGYVDAAVSGVPLANYQLLSEKGAANGYAQLDSGAKIPLSIIPDSILGQVEYQGTWNATTNTPTLVSPPASTTKGHYYITSVAGTQFGISFEIGDWIISDGTAWGKVDNSDAVMTVFGRLGNILALEADYSAFYPVLSGAYVNPSWLTSIPFSKLTATPTTIAGYGITDDTAQARLAISETITGIDYNNTTGVFSLTAGYEIPTTNTYLPLTGGTLTGDLNISLAAGVAKNLFFKTSGVSRWKVYSDSSSESGSNAGSNFNIASYDDAGGSVTNRLTINRATGAVILANGLTGTTANLSTSLQVPKIGIGTSAYVNINLYNTANITGSTSSYSNYTNSLVSSDVTTSAFGYRSHIGTQAAAFTLPSLYHNFVSQGTFGAGSTVNTQIGYYVDNTLVGATSNYGFYSNIPAGTGRLNFFSAGTALNAFVGVTLIGANAISAGSLGQLVVTPNNDATKGLVIRGFSPTQSANLQEWQNNAGTVLSSISSGGSIITTQSVLSPTFYGSGISSNSGKIDIVTNGVSITRNIADSFPALVVNNVLGTNYIQTWLQAGSGVGGVSSVGTFYGQGISNFTSPNNSVLFTASTGATISRNIADANDVLTINNIHASSTGLLIDFQAAGATVASVNKAGNVTSTQFKLSALNTAPASSTDTGTTGEIRYTATAIYLCTATDTWVKADLATF